MKRLTAGLALTALALTGCGQAGNEQSAPEAEQTTASNSQQGADEAVHSTGDLRRAMEALSLIHISEPKRREWLSRMPSSA